MKVIYFVTISPISFFVVLYALFLVPRYPQIMYVIRSFKSTKLGTKDANKSLIKTPSIRKMTSSNRTKTFPLLESTLNC